MSGQEHYRQLHPEERVALAGMKLSNFKPTALDGYLINSDHNQAV